ncbi:MAG: aminotransferase class V-fold PLP-dependent enzyme [Candidatus Aenigmarchaeota archaeon]|nr:aminotransferase class V-fold PLP-dependent enzyme [Candidatus Aenigmarchaeota archaeon]
MLNAEKIRKDFPVLERKVHGKQLVYFDNAAMPQIPVQVRDKVNEYLRNGRANVHRGIHVICRVLTFTAASNVLGTINPAREMIKRAHDAGALTIVDGAQSVPHMPVDVKKLGCDFLAFSGYKMLGPTGIGVLFMRKELQEQWNPYLVGSDMIKEVHLYETRYTDPPVKFEPGTPNIEGAIGLGAAVDYLSSIGMDSVRKHEEQLVKYSLDKFGSIKGMNIYGPRDPKIKGGVISFNLADIHAHDMATLMDEDGIAIRSGHHCAQPLMERLCIPGASRASYYIYNTEREIDVLAKSLERAKKIFNVV